MSFMRLGTYMVTIAMATGLDRKMKFSSEGFDTRGARCHSISKFGHSLVYLLTVPRPLQVPVRPDAYWRLGTCSDGQALCIRTYDD